MKMRMRTAIALLFLCVLSLGRPIQAAELRFFVGGGFSAATKEIGPAFERATGHRIVPTFDSQGGLQKRIDASEPFDVLLIGPGLVDPLIKQGKIVPATRVNVARAGLGVAVRPASPKPDISSVDAFKRALTDAKAVAYVGEGHSGQYFAAMLTRLGIADEMKPKLKPLGVSGVAKAVASGEADLAVWVIPGILGDRSVELAGPLPAELQDYVELTAGLAAEAKDSDAAKEFIKFLKSDAATQIIKAKGWDPVSK